MNVKLAFRTLFKTPFVTAVAIISLALGIGANAAIFSLFEQMLLRPLPVADPERLVNLEAPGPKSGSTSCNQSGGCEVIFSYPMFRDLERQQKVFTGIAGHRMFGANMAYEGQTLNGEAAVVSGSYFPVLGIQPTLGRLLTPADDQAIGSHFVTVLSHRFWETRLGSDPKVLDKTIIVNGHPMTIVGVGPKGFDGTTLGSRPNLFVPLSMRAQMSPGFRGFENRRNYWVYLFARLKPGVSIEQAKTGLNGLYSSIINEVEVPLHSGMTPQTLERFKAKKVEIVDGRRGQSQVHAEARTPLILLFAVTGIVLLIACANIANLLLARGAGRSLEMAVRLSLGASRRQLLTQLLTESVLLAVLGGIASILVAYWTLNGISSLLPGEVAQTLQPRLSTPALLFAAALSLGTGLLFGMFPALHSTRPDLVSTIRANTGQPSGAKAATRFRTSLVTAQIALSMALLVSAGLFIRSLRNVARVDLGVQIDNLITFAVSPELSGYTRARSGTFFPLLEERMSAIPGVTGVAASRVPLLSGDNWGNDVSVEGYTRVPDGDNESRFNMVSPGYFRTVGIPLLAGREFTASDVANTPKVVIVNEQFTKKFNLGRNAVGKRMAIGGDSPLDIEIVGVVRNAKYAEVKQEIPAVFHMAYRQDTTVGRMYYYVRTSLPPEQILRTIPSVVKQLDPNLPVEDLKTMPQQVKENVFLDRMISILAATFAGLATLLAAVGLYGVLAYTVAQRTREIGVRMALGANSRVVRSMVLWQVAKMTVIGAIIGGAAAVGLGRAATSLLYELKGHDPLVFALATLFLAIVALGAGYIPAIQASRVEPMQALRYE
jgi:predicted permease